LFNDIECMSSFAQLRILDSVKTKISISAYKLQDYEAPTRQIVARHSEISVVYVDEGFFDWIKGRRKLLSVGDLSSIYAAITHQDTTIILSPEDLYIKEEAVKHSVPCVTLDAFVTNIINDERAQQIYQLLKTA
jgi:hypothetical protein